MPVQFSQLPIDFVYASPSPDFMEGLRANDAAVELHRSGRLQIENTYYQRRLPGSRPQLYLRKALVDKLHAALRLLDEKYSFIIFDGYRSRETQHSLFETYSAEVKGVHPEWTEEQIQVETRKFIAHPNDPTRYTVAPHNSGGAVDLTLAINGHTADLGTAFDDFSDRAGTNFFEAASLSPEVRQNRRILFHAMKSVGFSNYSHEWWHYDLGNSPWSKNFKVPEVYGSMTSLIPS